MYILITIRVIRLAEFSLLEGCFIFLQFLENFRSYPNVGASFFTEKVMH
jgi:hypothetical protein